MSSKSSDSSSVVISPTRTNFETVVVSSLTNAYPDNIPGKDSTETIKGEPDPNKWDDWSDQEQIVMGRRLCSVKQSIEIYSIRSIVFENK
jgi:hypothetical protein